MDEPTYTQRLPPVIREIDISRPDITQMSSFIAAPRAERRYRYGSRDITLEEVKVLKSKVGGIALLHNRNLPIDTNIMRR